MTKADVFIIESLKIEDERKSLYEGKILSEILHLSGKKPIYYYIRTIPELEKMMDIFREANYRYLHLSCHGDQHAMFTTLDRISFSNLASILRPHLCEKRLFISACQMTNRNLARAILPDSECYSIIGPQKDVYFNDATILWSSFYHLMFSNNPAAMKRQKVLENMQNVSNMFKVPLNYFYPNKTVRGGYSLRELSPSKNQSS